MLFERLNANGMTFSDAQQGLILLNAIPEEWLTVAQIYSQANRTLATTTFLGVRDTIIVPTYTKQTYSKSAPPKASGDAPSGAPKKKTQRGGNGNKA